MKVSLNTSRSTPGTVYITTNSYEVDKEVERSIHPTAVATITYTDFKTGMRGYLHVALDHDDYGEVVAVVTAHGRRDDDRHVIPLLVDIENTE